MAYAEGDASLMTYKLGAKQDDSYYSTFSSRGWWNADRLSDRQLYEGGVALVTPP